MAYDSFAYTLVAGDTNGAEDVFVRDRQTGETTLVSVRSSGQQGNGDSLSPSISADGRYVAFTSWASNLVDEDTNIGYDVFVHDRQTGETTIVSVSSSGQQGNDYSYKPSISANGRYVALISRASNLVDGGTNGVDDVFVHDQQTDETTLVSVSSSGQQANGYCDRPSISGDGRYVAFTSWASNLVFGDTNETDDIFVHDQQTNETERVSVSSSGEQGLGNEATFHNSSISADGRYVAYDSFAYNLVAGDMNGTDDVFLHDRRTGETSLVSVSSSGEQGNGGSFDPSISADGRNVAFDSFASNLVVGDTNGREDVFLHFQQGNGGYSVYLPITLHN